MLLRRFTREKGFGKSGYFDRHCLGITSFRNSERQLRKFPSLARLVPCCPLGPSVSIQGQQESLLGAARHYSVSVTRSTHRWSL